MTTRLTRKEQQARTRCLLLRSATSVLAAKGLQRASIDDITSHAGFTKGAFYANFKSKEDLFLVMLDEHFADRLDAIERLTSDAEDLAAQAERVGQDFAAALRGDEEWSRLFHEFATHAMRHESFRLEFAARNTTLRERIAAIYERRAGEMGIVPGVSADVIARMTFAMAHGVAMEHLLDPATPDELFGVMLRIFFTGILTESTPAPAS